MLSQIDNCKTKLTSLAISLEALAVWKGIASSRRS